jgi:hypothetical protein
MALTRNHFAKWIFLFLLPIKIIALSFSLAYAQWISVNPPTVSDEWSLEGVHFTSTDEGWAVGWDAIKRSGVILRYHGGSWTMISSLTVNENWGLMGIHFTSADEGWAVGYAGADENCGGALLHYQNGTWTSVTPPALSGYWDLQAVHFTSAVEGWAVGWDVENYRGSLLHYKNGAWTSVAPPTMSGDWNWRLFGVHFTSADEGWAVGRSQHAFFTGVLLHYQGGVWTEASSPFVSSSWDLQGVYFTSADEGWAVGTDFTNYRGALLHYQSGDWASVTPPDVSSYWGLSSIHFASPTEGWAVGFTNSYPSYNGALLHHVSGEWASVTPPDVSSGWFMNGVHFVTGTEGWSVGYNTANKRGVLLRTLSVTPKEGTIGTRLTISGSGFGSKKGKIFMEGITAKIDKDGWFDHKITALLAKVPPPGGPYSVNIDQRLKPTVSISLNDAFTVKNLELNPLLIDSDIPGAQITITGKHFSSKKGTIHLGDKKCKLLTWEMNAKSGESTASFVVPKKMASGTYNVTVTNKLGSDTIIDGFTIP